MPKLCYLVPDFCGSELAFGLRGQQLPWWRFPAELVVMRLDSGNLVPGTSTRAPGTQVIKEAGGLLSLYDSLHATLTRKLPADVILTNFGHDFRLPMIENARSLADDIKSGATADQPARIVAHGAGGLIARWAYALLKDQSLDNLVAKVVTLGTPHYGCYALGDLWDSRDNVQNDLCQMYTATLPGFQFAPWLQGPIVTQTKLRAAVTINTWQGAYDYGPWLGNLQLQKDPRAASFWTIGNHDANLQIQQVCVDEARTGIQNALLAAAHVMPPAKLKCVIGTGFDTIQSFKDETKLPLFNAYNWSTDGDGVVAAWSAAAGSTNTYALKCEHTQLPNAPRVKANIVKWLYEEEPPPPIPLPDLLNEVKGQTPVPNSSPNAVDVNARVQAGVPASCVTGTCKC